MNFLNYIFSINFLIIFNFIGLNIVQACQYDIKINLEDVPNYYKIAKNKDKTKFVLDFKLIERVYKLVEAAQNGRIQVIQKYIDDGLDVNYQTFDNLKHKVIPEDNHDIEILRLAREFCLGPQCALIEAVHDNHLNTLRLLLDNKANINIIDWCGNTALKVAVFQGHEGIIDELLKRGADVNIESEHGFNALRVAAQSYNPLDKKKRIILKLLNANAKPINRFNEIFYFDVHDDEINEIETLFFDFLKKNPGKITLELNRCVKQLYLKI